MITKNLMKHLEELKKQNRGQMGLNLAKGFVVTLLSLAIIGIVVAVVLRQLGSTSVIAADAGSINVINNTTAGMATFFSNIPTWFALVSIVIIILIISVVVSVVNKFGGGGGKTSL